MPSYDYKCARCRHVTEWTFTSWRHAPKRKRCVACGSRTAAKVIGTKNFIHPTLSSLYDREEPALGYEKFGSYDNKRRLLKKWNADEGSDPVHGARQYRPELPPPRKDAPTLMWGDDVPTHM